MPVDHENLFGDPSSRCLVECLSLSYMPPQLLILLISFPTYLCSRVNRASALPVQDSTNTMAIRPFSAAQRLF